MPTLALELGAQASSSRNVCIVCGRVVSSAVLEEVSIFVASVNRGRLSRLKLITWAKSSALVDRGTRITAHEEMLLCFLFDSLVRIVSAIY